MLKKLLRDLTKYLPSKVLPALTAFITMPIITRLFAPEEYGKYVLAFLITELLYALFCSGLGSGALRFYPEYRKRGELGTFFGSLAFNMLLAVVSASILALVALLFLKSWISSSLYYLLQISILLFVVRSISTVFLDISRSREKGGTYTTFTLLTRYTGLGLGLTLIVLFGFQIEGLLWGEFLAFLVFLPAIVGVSIKGSSIHWKNLSLKGSKSLLNWAWPLGIGNLAMWSLNASDRYVIGLYRPENEIGLYSIGYQISEKTIAMIVALFILSMEALIVNVWESRGRRETVGAITVVTKTYLILCLPACVGITILAGPIVKILTTEPYYDGYRIIGYVAFSTFFWGLSMISIMGLVIGKKTRLIAFNQLIAAVVNFGLNLILVPRFGFVAAGITTLIGFVFLFFLQTHQSQKVISWFFPFKTLMNVIVASFFMGIALLIMLGFDKTGIFYPMVFIFLAIVLCGSLYFATLLVLGEVSRDHLIGIKNIGE